MSKAEQIVLTFPAKADHVSLARLTASGVASKCGFDIDAIEDLKVCVSEILNKLIAVEGNKIPSDVHLSFSCLESALEIRIGAAGLTGQQLFVSEEDAFALAILHTLMDEVNLSGEGLDAVLLVKAFGEVMD